MNPQQLILNNSLFNIKSFFLSFFRFPIDLSKPVLFVFFYIKKTNQEHVSFDFKFDNAVNFCLFSAFYYILT